jgi:WXXGXW repeat (2 copies)
MATRTSPFCVLLAAGTALAPGIGNARVYVDIDIAPPPPRAEVVPAPRAGYVWAPGYWEYHNRHHRWARGHWIRERHGRHWVPAHWEERHHRWHFEAGHWD